jgi:hypothetical protein
MSAPAVAATRTREWEGTAVLAVVLLIGMAGIVAGVVGTAWDVSWHRTEGRDSFWIPPHIWTYTGVTLGGVAALIATLTAMLGRRVRGDALAIGPIRAERGIAIVGIGSALIMASAPFDDMWHNAFGPDVDIWSPPHLAAIAAATLVYLGWALALAPRVLPIAAPLRRVLRLLMFGALVGTAVFAMNFWYFMAVTRDALAYPLLVCATIPLILALGSVVTGERPGATKIALAYTLIALAAIGGLRLAQWLPPAFPPLVLAGAIAVDLVRRRTAHPLAIGAAFAIAFVAADWARVLLFPPPFPGDSPASLDRGTRLMFQYVAQAQARPWASAWPLVAAALGSVASAGSWLAGARIGRLFRPLA